jgi:glycerate kinase
VKIVCAPASFKETLSAGDAARAMAAGAMQAGIAASCEAMPVGDGGEGTMDALADALGGSFVRATVMGPLMRPVDAQLAIIGARRLAIVELAQLSGLMLVPPAQRDPTRTTTFGTGQLIALAIEQGCEEVIVCIGGSATVDGGAAIAQALGAKFYDASGKTIDEPLTGQALLNIARVDRSSMKLPRVMRIACDVTNPLCGPDGAAHVYGPQKGATPEQVNLLDRALKHLASVTGGDTHTLGAGAAGGAGFGLATLCRATLESGIELVLDTIDFDRRCGGASLVLTGEGRLDAQSLSGKACVGVARRAARLGVPTIAIVGSTGPGGADCVNSAEGGALKNFFSLTDRFGESRAKQNTALLIETVAAEIVRDWQR